MTSAGPWSVKGVDPQAREIAKDLARRSGMTLGEWLNQVIVEGGEPEAPPFQAPYREPFAADAAARRPAALGRPPEGYRPEGMPHPSFDVRQAELERITEALQTLSARMEAAEHRSTLAISGVDQSVMGVLSRLEGAERDQVAVASRFEGAIEALHAAQGKTGERLRKLENEDGPRVEALKALESALGRVAAQVQESERAAAARVEAVEGRIDARLQEGEQRTQGAADALRDEVAGQSRRMNRLEAAASQAPETYADAAMVEGALTRMAGRLDQAEARANEAARQLAARFAALDARLNGTEERLGEVDGGAVDRRFEQLAAELSQKVEAARNDMAAQLREAATGQIDKVEGALHTLSGQVEQSEQRSAQAIDRMGREVLRVAQSLGQRVAESEARAGQAVARAGGEMARVADAMEARWRHADQTQAEALEKLSAEITRIAGSLAERIASSERRSASAIDDVGEQVGRAADRIDQRYERAGAELAERIRLSEARTAQLLDEARERLDQRLAEAERRRRLDDAAPRPPAVVAGVERAPAASDPFDPFSPGPAAPVFEPLVSAPVETETRTAVAAHDGGSDMGDGLFEATPDPALTDAAHEAGFGSAADPGDAVSGLFEAEPATASARGPSSTRDLLDSARAAARQAASGRSGVASVAAPPFEPEAISRRFGLSLPKRRRKSEDLRTAGIATVTAVALTATAIGAWRLYDGRPSSGAKPNTHATSGPDVLNTAALTPTAAPRRADAAPSPDLAGAPADQASGPVEPTDKPADLAAVALSPAPTLTVPQPAHPAAKPSAPSKAVAASAPAVEATKAAAAPVSAALLYSGAVRRIGVGDRGGVADLQRAANLGLPAAQFYLAKLYEDGGAGLKKTPAEARRWYQRAAEAGDAKAMYNLGMAFYDGEGGDKNLTTAAGWFRRAADLGLSDAQYNLAQLYQSGAGVSQDPAESYKWYLIAAAQGDEDARKAAVALRPGLPPEAAALAERSAAAVHAQARGGPTAVQQARAQTAGAR